ncbi:prepilin-type N-terminal cleavage/methylation domain-containing protein [Inmirania thermothiophila]|uniref:MSHA biogenesis protein MshO n=1 Tax=Inmirania thermothiophila TaxID=1750597 RepID=A0A3N1Y5V0_9GAMM|nr:prepilin-type N-terminal cleavage/methylation domain-containing protein [Inmirania thermothiophila]ROR34196.1 MSHA biogenesis protein MshO [Inmirania thermothiophila]
MVRGRGFTLVELVAVMTIIGAIAAVAASFIPGAVTSYQAVSRRAELTAVAELALQRMARDLRAALPNSVRVTGGGTVLELVESVDAARYRDDPPPGSPDAVLDFTAPDDAFDVIGRLTRFAEIQVPGDAVVIYNLGVAGADAYAGDNRAALAGGTTDSHIALAAPTQFPRPSPRQRFFVVRGPVTYLCDPAAGTLTRYHGYGWHASQADVDTTAELAALGAGEARMAAGVTACSFTYQAGTSRRAALATLRISLAQGDESVTLLRQVHVVNAP